MIYEFFKISSSTNIGSPDWFVICWILLLKVILRKHINSISCMYFTWTVKIMDEASGLKSEANA